MEIEKFQINGNKRYARILRPHYTVTLQLRAIENCSEV
jgi:hypothetical protein